MKYMKQCYLFSNQEGTKYYYQSFFMRDMVQLFPPVRKRVVKKIATEIKNQKSKMPRSGGRLLLLDSRY